MIKIRRKYDIRIDGYRIRRVADFDRIDMNKSERALKHRRAKLLKREELRRADTRLRI